MPHGVVSITSETSSAVSAYSDFTGDNQHPFCRVPSIYDPNLQKKCELQLCVLIADAPISIQKCKWQRNSSGRISCAYMQL